MVFHRLCCCCWLHFTGVPLVYSYCVGTHKTTDITFLRSRGVLTEDDFSRISVSLSEKLLTFHLKVLF